MPDLTIHAIPQEDLAALDARASRHGHTTEHEVLHLIHEAAAAERLVQQLERAQRAEDVIRRGEPRKRAAPAPRGRYRTVEPTPHRYRETPPPTKGSAGSPDETAAP